MANLKRMQLVLEQIQINQARWDQRSWNKVATDECGATFCTAGWATQLFVGKPPKDAFRDDWFELEGAKALELTNAEKTAIFYFTGFVIEENCSHDSGGDGDYTCYVDVNSAGVPICQCCDDHNRPPTFEEMVAQVEKVLPDFHYEWVTPQEMATIVAEIEAQFKLIGNLEFIDAGIKA